ncbi:ABC transporter ATP-binding protein [Streptomyces sp. NPDC019396]|uniref:ABC transporter ATP-binding protein n=1 Tax=Streptomyces sp. NPDC019396 TaxID=3154687 RepID=UPI0033E4D8ED
MSSRLLTTQLPGPAVQKRRHTTVRLGLSPAASALLADSLRGSGRPLLRIAALSAVEAAPALASGWVTAIALDQGFLRHRPDIGVAWLAVLAALYLVRAVAERGMFDPMAAVIEPMRDRLTRRVVHNSLAQAATFDQAPDTAGVSRLTGQVDTVRNLTATLMRTARPLTVSLLAALAGLAGLAPLLAVLVLVPLTVAVAVFLWTMRRLTALRRSALIAGEEVAGCAGEVLAATRDIASLGAEDQAAALVEARSDEEVRSLVRVGRAASLRITVILVGGYVPLVGLLLMGPRLIEERAITAGALIGAATYVAGSVVPALQLMTSAVSGYWSQLGVLLHRLAESAPELPPTTPPAAPVPPAHPGTAALVAERIAFAYGPGADPVLKGLDLHIPYGDYLAITGASGIGKSTLAMLLAGIRTPTSGAVLVAGVPVTGLPEEQRRGLIALVPQEAYVFPGTVRDNLRYLAPAAGDIEIAHAAATVGLTPLLTRLGGLDAVLGDPAGGLSSGERQLLALARTYLCGAPIVILDEATSHLDPAAEHVAESAFRAKPGTLIVIAHRSSSAARADRVLHIDADHVSLTAVPPSAATPAIGTPA